MKIFNDIEQGTPEWFEVRRGVFTASEASKIITSTGKESTQIKGLIYHKVAEIISAQTHQIDQTPAMVRGHELEPEARDFFEFETGLTVEQAGFCRHDSLMAGCSPDGLIKGKNAGLEIKCPLPHTHVKYLAENKVPAEYYPQVQHSMLATEFNKWWFISYCPDFMPLIIQVERDDEFCDKLESAIIKASKKAASMVKEFSL